MKVSSMMDWNQHVASANAGQDLPHVQDDAPDIVVPGLALFAACDDGSSADADAGS